MVHAAAVESSEIMEAEIAMEVLFMASYALLGGLAVFEAMIISWVLRETLRCRRLYASRLDKMKKLFQDEASDRLPRGATIPEFAAPLLSTGGLINTSHLKGHNSILLFVAPEEPSPFYEQLSTAAHAFWHEVEGHLYIVCNGRQEPCRTFVSKHLVEDFAGHKVPVILDEDGYVTRRFLVKKFPQAVSINEDLQVHRYGQPAPSKEAGPDVDEPQTKPAPSESAINDQPCDWPDSRPFTGATFARVDTTVSCVLTRFRLRSAWSLVPFYIAFRRIRRESQKIAGLLQSLFLIEDLRTCYTLSIWKNDCAIVDFGRVRSHIEAANSAFGPTYRRDLERPEIWSAQFRLWAVSSHNMNWEGFDLQPVLGDQWEKRELASRARHLD